MVDQTFPTRKNHPSIGKFLAVGEIDLDGNSLRLQSTKTGPMLLTTATKNTLIKKFEEAKSSMM